MNGIEGHVLERVPNILAYVSRSKVTDWKRLLNPRIGEELPFLYGSNDGNIFSKAVKKGSVLWVISATPDGQPPSLVARLVVVGRLDGPDGEAYGVPEPVARAFRKSFAYVAVGDRLLSRFYGHNDASRALLGLKLRWVNKERTISGQKPCPRGTCTWKSSFSIPLNRPAVIVGDLKPLTDLDAASDRCVFISWKRSDNWTRRASIRNLAYALAAEGVFVWLDVLAMPTSVALRTRVDRDSEMVRSLLHYGYERSKGLLAIETENYGAKGISENWTAMEWTGNLAHSSQASAPDFRWLYRFEKSLFLDDSLRDQNLMKAGSWRELAEKIRDEMDSHDTRSFY